MNSIIYRHIIFLLICLSGPILSTAQPEFNANVSKTKIGDKEYLQAGYVLENVILLTSFNEPSFKGFRVIGTQKPFGQVLTNGKLNRYYAFIYTLEPETTGSFVIEPATAKADGQTFTSKQIKVQVVNGPSPAAPNGDILIISLNQSRHTLSPLLDDFVLKKGEHAEEKIRRQVFVKVETDKKEVYIGEPILTTYKLYTRLRNDARITRRPPFNGFSVFEMNNPLANITHTETIGGKQYDVYIIRQAQLFPLQEGPAQLEPVEIESKVKLIRGDVLQRADISPERLINAYFYNNLGDDVTVTTTLLLQTEPVNIVVKPLPAEGRPGDFTGAVGQFSIDAKLNNTQFATGKSSVLSVQLRGRGNLPVINFPALHWPGEAEAFEPKINEDYDAASVPLGGVKTFDYSFVPLKEGRFVIPATRFSYFDPAAKRYQTIGTDSFVVSIAKGKINNGLSDTGEKNMEVIKTRAIVPSWLIWLLPVTGVFLLFFVLRKWNSQQKRKEDHYEQQQWQELLQQQEVLKITPIHNEEIAMSLPSTREYLREPGKKFYSSLQNDLWVFMEKQVGYPGIDRSKSRLRNYLLQRNTDAGTVNELIGIITLCETALYAPFDREEDRELIVIKTEGLLKKIS